MTTTGDEMEAMPFPILGYPNPSDDEDAIPAWVFWVTLTASMVGLAIAFGYIGC